jgi:uncharacterized protein YkwD
MKKLIITGMTICTMIFSNTAVFSAEPEITTAAETAEYTLCEDELGVIELVNEERIKAGLPPVTLNIELSKVARVKAGEMVTLDYFDHKSPVYGSSGDMIKGFGIECKSSGECIAYQGGTSPKGAVYNWMHSEGHRKIILYTDFTEVGIGLAEDGTGLGYWSLMFIGSSAQ